MKPFTHKLLIAAIGLTSIFYTNHICAQSSGAETIDINNIDAMLHATGDHFWDLVSSPRFEVPKGSHKHTIFASSLWIGAYDNNNLHLAAMTYRQSGSDYWPGPLDTALGTIEAANSREWDKMWKVSKSEIEAFIKDKNQATDAIKTWPAHGNQSLGEAKYLAPFVDVDKDGVYDYTKGDYPKIKGDQAIWWIFNDGNLEHSESFGAQLRVEIHAMAYAFSSTDPVINNTIFFEYDIINRSRKNYSGMYTGLWTDFDLGYAFDDAIGSDSAQSAYFGYNSDTFDDGVNGYGENIPVQSVVFLKDSMKNFIYYNNDFTDTGNPYEPEHYYRYLSGTLRNGYPMINPKTRKPTKFAFSGNPLDTTTWVDRGSAKSGDRRGLGSTGPFELKRNKKHTFTFAYVTTYKESAKTDDNLKNMYGDIAKVKNYYKNIATGTPETNEFNNKNIEFTAYPNPASDILNLQWNNSSIQNVRIMNMLGQTVWSKNTTVGETGISIDTKHFPRGIYMAVIENGNQKAVKRVVLQ